MEQTTNSIFSNKSFTLLIIGQIISLLGSIVQRFALSLYVLATTGSGTMFASVLAISLIPTILLGPVAGVIADRYNKRNIMVILDILSAIVVGGMIFLAMDGGLSMTAIYACALLLSVFTAFYEPTVQASIPALVKGGEDQLLQANSLNSIIMTLSNLIGPVIAGVLYASMGLEAILLINAISFLAVAFLEMFMVIPQAKLEQSGSILKDFTNDFSQGYNYLRSDKYLHKLLTATLVANVFIAPIFTVGVAYVTKMTLKVSDQMYGLSEGIIMAGSLMAPIIVGLFTKKLDVKNTFFYAIMLSGLFLTTAGAVIWPAFASQFGTATVPFWLFTASGFGIVAVITTFNIVGITMVQNDTPGEMLGRVMSLITSLVMAATPLGQMMFGVLFDRYADNSQIPLLIAAAVTILLAVYVRISMSGYQAKERKAEEGESTPSASA